MLKFVKKGACSQKKNIYNPHIGVELYEELLL